MGTVTKLRHDDEEPYDQPARRRRRLDSDDPEPEGALHRTTLLTILSLKDSGKSVEEIASTLKLNIQDVLDVLERDRETSKKERMRSLDRLFPIVRDAVYVAIEEYQKKPNGFNSGSLVTLITKLQDLETALSNSLDKAVMKKQIRRVWDTMLARVLESTKDELQRLEGDLDLLIDRHVTSVGERNALKRDLKARFHRAIQGMGKGIKTISNDELDLYAGAAIEDSRGAG